MAFFKEKIKEHVRDNMVRMGIAKCKVEYAGKVYYGKNKRELIELIWDSIDSK